MFTSHLNVMMVIKRYDTEIKGKPWDKLKQRTQAVYTLSIELSIDKNIAKENDKKEHTSKGQVTLQKQAVIQKFIYFKILFNFKFHVK